MLDALTRAVERRGGYLTLHSVPIAYCGERWVRVGAILDEPECVGLKAHEVHREMETLGAAGLAVCWQYGVSNSHWYTLPDFLTDVMPPCGPGGVKVRRRVHPDVVRINRLLGRFDRLAGFPVRPDGAGHVVMCADEFEAAILVWERCVSERGLG